MSVADFRELQLAQLFSFLRVADVVEARAAHLHAQHRKLLAECRLLGRRVAYPEDYLGVRQLQPPR